MTDFQVLQTTEIWTPGATLSHSATITWTASVDAVDGYNVYRSLTPGTEAGPPLNGTTLVTGTTYVDSTVKVGIPYFYEVTAVANGVESLKSIEAKSSVILPAAPTNVVVSQTS